MMFLCTPRLWSTATLLVLGLAIAPPLHATDSTQIEYQNGQLSAHFTALNLDTALTRIAKETGITFSINPGSEDGNTVQVELDRHPLEEGIRKILNGYNYMMLYETDSSGSKRVSRVIVLSRSQERRSLRQDVAGTVQVQPPPAASDLQIMLTRDRNGHYMASGTINNQPTHFIIDTGATLVAVPDELADRIGLAYGKEKRMETANGATIGYATVLNRVQLGGLMLDGVPAVIMPDMNLGDYALLGMSFLGSFELIQRNDVLTIRPHDNP